MDNETISTDYHYDYHQQQYYSTPPLMVVFQDHHHRNNNNFAIVIENSTEAVNNVNKIVDDNDDDTVYILIVSIILGILTCLTIIGNVFVIAAIKMERNLRTTANYLVLSLAVADLMVACFVMPLGAVTQIRQQWTLGTLLCDIWTSADVLCCTASILHLLAIALDRYWAVTYVDYIHKRTPKRICLMIFTVWTVAFIVSIPPLIGWKDPDFNVRVEQEKRCLISQDIGYQVFATISTFYGPLIFILLLYWKIYQVARKRIRHKPGKTIAPASSNVNPKVMMVMIHEVDQAKGQSEKNPKKNRIFSANKLSISTNGVDDMTTVAKSSTSVADDETELMDTNQPVIGSKHIGDKNGSENGFSHLQANDDDGGGKCFQDLNASKLLQKSFQHIGNDDDHQAQADRMPVANVSSLSSPETSSSSSSSSSSSNKTMILDQTTKQTTMDIIKIKTQVPNYSLSTPAPSSSPSLVSTTKSTTKTITAIKCSNSVGDDDDDHHHHVNNDENHHHHHHKDHNHHHHVVDDVVLPNDSTKKCSISPNLMMANNSNVTNHDDDDDDDVDTDVDNNQNNQNQNNSKDSGLAAAAAAHLKHLNEIQLRKAHKESIESKRERKAAKILAIITGIFVMCWLPFFVMALLMPLCKYCQPSKHIFSFFLWLGYCNSLLNPIIYTIFSPDFRNGFRRILCGKKRRRR